MNSKIQLKSTGIYKIQNTLDFKCYIGSAQVSFTNRFAKHRNDLRSNKHHCQHLQNAWNKYGESNFIFVPILEKQPEECLDWEQYFFDFYKPEYNILQIARNSGMKYKNHSEESRNKNAKSFLLISPNGKIVEGKNIRQFCRDHNLNREGIKNLINFRGKVRSFKGWTRSFEDYLVLKCYGSFSNYNSSKQKPEYIKNPEGKIFKVTNQSAFCKENQLETSSLCLLLKNKIKTHKGWTLSSEEEYKNFCDQEQYQQ